MNELPSNGGHCKNILSPDYQEIGVGYFFIEDDEFKHYWTQDFGKRATS